MSEKINNWIIVIGLICLVVVLATQSRQKEISKRALILNDADMSCKYEIYQESLPVPKASVKMYLICVEKIEEIKKNNDFWGLKEKDYLTSEKDLSILAGNWRKLPEAEKEKFLQRKLSAVEKEINFFKGGYMDMDPTDPIRNERLGRYVKNEFLDVLNEK